MDTCKETMTDRSEEDIKRRIKIVEDEAAARACEVHRLNKEREMALYDRIDALKRQLLVCEKACSVCFCNAFENDNFCFSPKRTMCKDWRGKIKPCPKC